MKVHWRKQSTGKEKDITNYISSVTWSGSATQAGRSLDISVAYSPLDKNINELEIKPGDRLKLYENNQLLINAMVYTRERVSGQGTISFSSYDELNRIANSTWTNKFSKTTPEEITYAACNNLKVEKGKIAITNVGISKLLINEEGYYNTIMKAYKKASLVNDKKYMPMMYDKKLYVIEKGEIINNYILHDKVNILSSNYNETLEGMVNKVRIYDDQNKQQGVIQNEDSISLYGIFQSTYTKQDKENATLAATKLLKGIEKTASIEALGNISCISGFGIKIKDSLTGLVGIFWIENDTHTWENGNHTMSLELAFKNIMSSGEG